MKLTLMMSTTLNITFMNTKQPMILIVIILAQTTLTTFMMSNYNKSSWFNYILMIIFIGGMMVLFIYITSITPNEKNNYLKLLPMMLIMTIMFYLYEKKTYFHSSETLNMQLNTMSPDQMNMKMMFNYPLYSLSIMMMIYLFIALVAINKISNLEQGPLRMNSN
uniref:NADH-ubiquinone oxidoreductase chain 6 n=1 Tax=Yunnantettix bannaensis TaxID=2708011 RepID=A0A6G6BJX0_9ORTH|nr:NADH dehydrogenase subunit 6 [Yunnantettix bannaensis]